MTDYLESTVDKFNFKVATDRYYATDGLWVKPEEGSGIVRVGLSDFLQQSNGDVAFADVRAAGTVLAIGDDMASIETIKVAIILLSPVAGTIVEKNPAMISTPELINQDPYGEGWLARIEIGDWGAARAALMEPQAYFVMMKGQAEEEAKKL